MENSVRPIESQRGDHDYFVSSETIESWSTKDENCSENPVVTVLNSESNMTSNTKHEDEFDVIEEEIVESLMIVQEEDLDDSSRTSIDDKAEPDAKCESKVGSCKKQANETGKVVDASDLDFVTRNEDDSCPKTGVNNVILSASSSSRTTEVSDVVRRELHSNTDRVGNAKGASENAVKHKIAKDIAETCNKANSLNAECSNDSVRDSAQAAAELEPEHNRGEFELNVADKSASVTNRQRRNTNESLDFTLSLENNHNNLDANIIDDAVADPNDSENDAFSKVCDSSTMSNASGDDSIDFSNEPNDEVDMSDVSSSFAESENINDVTGRNKLSPTKRPRRRQPPNMIGYTKRRKVHHLKKLDDEYDLAEKLTSHHNDLDATRISEADERSEGSSNHAFESSSSEENLFEGVNSILRPPMRRSSSSASEPSDRYCWTCHKESGVIFKCLACPRVFHNKCYVQISGIDPSDERNNFQCPECVAILRADNVNTRSPTLATVNLDQLCVSLKHVIDLLKAQKDSHYFWGPVDTKEFPHYREYVAHPMDLMTLEKNVSNKIYGCTEAFLADVKWIVHNSIIFNSKASKITNVAKNLLKICKREIAEIETCAECYYNSLVRIDTWFIEVCKRPHILVWARLKGYPPWPAKALKCKDNMVDCRFFGAHDKAWVPLKDCFLYSKIPPQPTKMKKSNHLEFGIKELEKHISKLEDKFGVFAYPPARTPYQPAVEFDQIRLMLPNYDPKSVSRFTGKYLVHPDRLKGNVKPKVLFNEKDGVPTKEESDVDDEKRLEEADSESTCTDDQDKPLEVPPLEESLDTDVSISSSENEASNLPDDWKIDKSDNLGETSRVKPAQEKFSPSIPKSAENINSNTCAKNSILSSPKTDERNKVEETAKPRKFVVVRNIDTINASVTSNDKKEHTENGSKVSSTSSSESDGLVCRTNLQTTSSPLSGRSLQSKQSAPHVDKGKKSNGISSDTVNEDIMIRKDSDQFDLDKVKDEPMDVDVSGSGTDELIVEKHIIRPAKSVQSSLFVSNKTKRTGDEDAVVNATNTKRLKPDSNLRSVNISENVTLSVINQVSNTDVNKTRVLNVKQGSHKKLAQPMSGNRIVVDGNNDTPSHVGKSKLVSPPVTKLTTGPSVISRSQVKILPRPASSPTISHTNGPTIAQIKPPTVMLPLKVDSSSSKVLANGLDEFLQNEYQNHFKKFFEDTMDKLAGKGDFRAKIFSLQKEMETLKRNHDLIIDELKREYEMQIAELRATSIAKTQFDLAAERLKFEQEKEKAVKEAKSKQWCSNCQKNANYYCCWNTAYCDFECQKEHWINHMHVCKNDVKKKAAESSENEPPRIMMQNDVASNYILNGYDKPGGTSTYSYQNSNSVTTVSRNLKKLPTSKNASATKANYRPLLPRISSTTNTSSLSSTSASSVSTTHLANSTLSLSESSTYQTVSSSTTNTLRPHSAIAVRQTTLFHK